MAVREPRPNDSPGQRRGHQPASRRFERAPHDRLDPDAHRALLRRCGILPPRGPWTTVGEAPAGVTATPDQHLAAGPDGGVSSRVAIGADGSNRQRSLPGSGCPGGCRVPLLSVQILWINLVTDGLPAIALGLEPVERDAMRRPHRTPTESIFARGLWQHVGLTMAAVCLALLVGARAAGRPWQTMVSTTLALRQLGHALAVRSEREASRSARNGTRSCWARSSGRSPSSSASCICRPCGACSSPGPWDQSSLRWSWSPRPRPRRRGAREVEHPPPVPKVPPFT